MRLSSVGGLRPCLFSEEEFDLKTPLRAGELNKVEALIKKAVASKPDSYTLPGTEEGHAPMSSIGG